MLTFARTFDPKLMFTPSQVDKQELNSIAENILGEPEKIVTLEFSDSPYLFINIYTMSSIRLMTDKYRIRLDLLVNWLDGVTESDAIKVNKDGWLVNIDKPKIFTNETTETKRAKELTEFEGYRRPKHIPIRQNDIQFFESLRIKHEDLSDVLHEIDRLLSRTERRLSGVFWTEREIGDMLADEIMQLVNPDYVVEPCVGGGSLIENIVPLVKGAMNDVSTAHVENCKKIFDGYAWKFTAFDITNTTSDNLLRNWGVPEGKKLLLYTNPPFGTSSASRLMSKKKEMIGKTSRKIVIKYPRNLEKYGKGNLFMPIVGRLVEIAKIQKTCYLAFFAPFGLFCGRRRYKKLLTALTKDFYFLKGYVFAGNNFHDINKTLPIALTIWLYKSNAHTEHLDLNFDFIDKNGTIKKIEFKKMPLIKDRWRYRDGSKYVKNKTKNAIGAPRCDAFNVPNIKIFGINLKEGSGAEISPDNLKSNQILIQNVPSELVYGLWSVAVGKHVFGTSLSYSQHPIYFEQAYVHLPDFRQKETIEILAYSALNQLIKNNADDRILWVE